MRHALASRPLTGSEEGWGKSADRSQPLSQVLSLAPQNTYSAVHIKTSHMPETGFRARATPPPNTLGRS